MATRFSGLVVLAASLLFSVVTGVTPVRAAIVSGSFTGTVFAAGDGGSLQGVDPATINGQPLVGSFSLDTSLFSPFYVPTPGDPYYIYDSANSNAASLSATVGAHVFTFVPGHIRIYLSTPDGPYSGHLFSLLLTSADGSENFAIGMPANYTITDLSSLIPILSPQQTSLNFNSVKDGNIGYFATEIDSIFTTPLPGALPLFVSGLAGLGFFAARQKRASRH